MSRFSCTRLDEEIFSRCGVRKSNGCICHMPQKPLKVISVGPFLTSNNTSLTHSYLKKRVELSPSPNWKRDTQPIDENTLSQLTWRPNCLWSTRRVGPCSVEDSAPSMQEQRIICGVEGAGSEVLSFRSKAI